MCCILNIKASRGTFVFIFSVTPNSQAINFYSAKYRFDTQPHKRDVKNLTKHTESNSLRNKTDREVRDLRSVSR